MEVVKGLISIIIPVYNGKEYLKECVRSILECSYSKIEILLIDDGSEKETAGLCDELSKSSEKIKTYHKENGGIVSARNFGLSKAEGEYITFSDQDDLVKKDMYKICINRIEKDKSDICICGCNKLINNTEREFVIINENKRFNSKNDIRDNVILPLMCVANRMDFEFDNPIFKNYYGFVWCAVFRREIIEKNKIKFTNFVDYEDDHVFVLNYLKYSSGVSLEKNVGYIWRILNSSVSHTQKYYTNMTIKRQNLTNFYVQLLKDIKLNESDLNRYKNELYQRDMINIIKNETSPINGKSNKEGIKYINEAYEKIIMKNNVKCRPKKKNKIKTFRDCYIRFFLYKKKFRLVYYIDKYIYNKFIIYIKEKIIK